MAIGSSRSGGSNSAMQLLAAHQAVKNENVALDPPIDQDLDWKKSPGGKTKWIDPGDGTAAGLIATMTSGITQYNHLYPKFMPAPKPDELFYSTWNAVSDVALRYMLNDGAVGKTDWYRFDRWYTIDRDKEEVSGRHYIFICRPDLNLLDADSPDSLNPKNGIASDGFFQYLANYHPEIIASLTGEFKIGNAVAGTGAGKAASGSGFGNAVYADGTTDKNGNPLAMHAFIPFLTGRIESLQLPDYTIKNYNLTQPYTRYSIPYAATAIESKTGGTFDITFRDDKDFSVRKMFYAWLYYMDGALRNKFQPKDKYILYNAFDYATSIYDIMVDATGENIIWWSKYTGCFPTSVPISDLSFNRGSAPDSKCSIPFVYFHHEDLDIGALLDLNYNSLGYTYMRNVLNKEGSYMHSAATAFNPPVYTSAIYNQTVGYRATFLGKNQVGRPVIFMKPKGENNRPVLKLRWLPMP